jgi:miniconductance mechanosensitive channel
MFEIIYVWLENFGINAAAANLSARVLLGLIVLFLAFISRMITRRVLLKFITLSIAKTKTNWDDIFLENKVFHRLAQFVPLFVVYLFIPALFESFPHIIIMIQSILYIYFIMLIVLSLNASLSSIEDIYQTLEVAINVPIKVFIQVFKVLVYFVGGIVVISIIIHKSPLYLLSGLGAITAVLMLVFKDSILGLVAGIQLTANKMISQGDWIEMPKYGADGDVLEVALTTVKVQNFDKTISTIPTYALISDSFKNWRGMSESGGRRIKRAINIDMNTIKFCDETTLKRFSKIQYISEYLGSKEIELAEYNKQNQIDALSRINGRHLTNIGTYRAYIRAYLRKHPMINQDMTVMVRQLASTEHGLPIEVYAFSSDKNWDNYEVIMADIFDHLLAIVPEFDLSVFQNPSGEDFKGLA